MPVLSLCSTVGVNTGGIDCDKKRGNPVKFFVGTGEFDSTDYAGADAFFTQLMAYVNMATGSTDKLFPFPEIQGTTPNTEANTTGALGYGLTFTLREGRPVYTFQILCGQTQYQRLRRFNKTTLPVLMLDDQSLVWGYKKTTGNFRGEYAQIFVSGNGFEDGNAAELKVATVEIAYVSAADFHDKSAYMEVEFAPSDVEGLVDAPLASVGAVSGTTKFESKIPTAKLGVTVNLYDKYKTQLAVAGAWTAKTGATFGTTLTITGVVANDSDKTWSVTFDATAYGALASAAQIKVNLADPGTLDGLNAPGIEGTAVIIVKP